jgi:Nif-specific regulatory protein
MPLDMAREHARLARLLELNQPLVGAVGPDELLRAILDAVTELLACEGCSIALVDEVAAELAFTRTVGPAGVAGFRLPIGQGIAGWVAASGDPVISNDVASDARFFAGVDAATGFTTRSILCVPLRQGPTVVGALEAINTSTADGFSKEDLELLTAFAGLASAAIDRSRAFTTLTNAKVALQEHVEDRYDLVIGESPALRTVVDTARAAAAARTTVLLLGESGVGKEVLARALHRWSPRVDGPFVAVNCVALTPELLESELFGHEKGAFTGAVSQTKGKFELADGGTLFLDEVGDLAPHLQAKLLRVLQEREFQRVGGSRDIRVDVRVVAATNRDLREAMRTGRFREDLYYRLNVVAITIPPLRERKDDIPALAERFLVRYAREVNRAPCRLSEEALQALMAHDWPGNVRELQNAIERAVVLAPGPVLAPRDFPPEITARPSASHEPGAPPAVALDDLPLHEAVDALKRTRIRAALTRAGGNQTRAARLLGMRQPNLSRLMKALGLG